MIQEQAQPSSKLGRADWIYVAALCALTSLVYLPQFFSGRTAMEAPEMVDVASQWFPGYTEEGNIWRANQFPLWYWQQYSGLPMLAYSHGGILYPPNIVLLTLFSFPDAATLLHLLHALAAALGTFLLLRSLGVSGLASFLAGLTFALSGFLFFFQSQFSFHATTAWVPLTLLAVRRLLLAKQAGWLALAAATVAAMLLPGDAEQFIYFLIFVFLFIVFYVRREAPGRLGSMLFLAGCAVALGLAVGSPLILSLMEVAARSIRAKSSPYELDFGAVMRLTQYLYQVLLPFKDFAFSRPGNAYNSGMPPLYIGVAPLLILPYAFSIYRRDRRVAALVNLAIAMIAFLAIRKSELLAPVVTRIPVIGRLGTVERTLALTQLAWIMAAAAAFDRLRASENRRWLVYIGVGLLIWTLANANLENFMAGGRGRYLAAAAMLALGAAALGTGRRKSAGSGALGAAAMVLVIGDVYLLALGCVPRTGKMQYGLAPAVQAFVDRQDPEYRFISFERFETHDRLPEVAGMIAANSDLGSSFGIMRLPDWRYFEFLHLIDRKVIRDWRSVLTNSPASRKQFYTADLYNPDFLNDKNLPLLDLTAAKYVFSRDIAFKFASPYSLLNEPGLVKEEYGSCKYGKGCTGGWRRREKPAPIGQMEARDQGRPFLETRFPQSLHFSSYVYPGAALALEFRPHSQDGGPWRGQVLISGANGEEEKPTILYASSIEAPSAKEVKIQVPLDALRGGMADFKIILASAGPEAEALIIDPRLVRPDAPFQRVKMGPLDVYINNNALPRSFIVHEALSLSGPEVRSMMTDPARFDPGRMVLFEKGEAPENLMELAARGKDAPAGADVVESSHHEGGMVKVRARLGSPGWLFVSDTLYPGWRAYVDGVEERIYRADLVFRAVFLTDGAHEVRFSYEPIGFRIGLWFGLASLLAFGALLTARRVRPAEDKEAI